MSDYKEGINVEKAKAHCLGKFHIIITFISESTFFHKIMLSQIDISFFHTIYGTFAQGLKVKPGQLEG